MEPEAYEEMYALEQQHWWYQGMRQITSTLIESMFPNLNGLRILDAGCGTGANLTALARYGDVYGFDYSPLALQYAQRDHSGRVARASVEALPYQDNDFDLVTSFDVLYCYEVGDDVASLKEFARVTKPGGCVLVRLPALPILRGEHDDVVHGARRYTAPELREKLAAAGLEVLCITYANAILLPAVFASRKLGALAVKLGRPASSDVGRSSGMADGLLKMILDLEAKWIGAGRGFPAGVSVFGVARRPVEPR